MTAVTWRPGEDQELDAIFDRCREQRYQDQSHRLHKNYSAKEFEYAGIIACTIYFENNKPELLSTISSRDCWPAGAYRILSRLWKHDNFIAWPKIISPSFEHTLRSQISWLQHNEDCKMLFIGRQSSRWEHWCIREFKKQFDLEFETDNYRYLTCPNECDDSCWQKIIYQGDSSLLEAWRRR